MKAKPRNKGRSNRRWQRAEKTKKKLRNIQAVDRYKMLVAIERLRASFLRDSTWWVLLKCNKSAKWLPAQLQVMYQLMRINGSSVHHFPSSTTQVKPQILKLSSKRPLLPKRQAPCRITWIYGRGTSRAYLISLRTRYLVRAWSVRCIIGETWLGFLKLSMEKLSSPMWKLVFRFCHSQQKKVIFNKLRLSLKRSLEWWKGAKKHDGTINIWKLLRNLSNK